MTRTGTGACNCYFRFHLVVASLCLPDFPRQTVFTYLDNRRPVISISALHEKQKNNAYRQVPEWNNNLE